MMFDEGAIGDVCNWNNDDYDINNAAEETGVSAREVKKAWRQAKCDADKWKRKKMKNQLVVANSGHSKRFHKRR
jgi:hypothetical protein